MNAIRNDVNVTFLLVLVISHLQLSQANAVVFSWTEIGNPGNTDDDATGFGAVQDEFLLARHEVTNAQYAEFLNNVAANDPNSLYNVNMAGPRGGILRNGLPGNYTYSVVAGRARNPVNYVSFFDAMRFINWLANGQGSGDTETGVYNISDGISEVRSSNAYYFLPNEDEWCKAAYHQPQNQGGDIDDYWLYPTSSNLAPIAEMEANYRNTIGDTVRVGSYPPNYYGTFDMGGNVWEWNEAVIDQDMRVNRGGSWFDLPVNLRSIRGRDLPSDEGDRVGFRVAARIPAPCGPKGDFTNDGSINLADIPGFVAVLLNPCNASAEERCLADMNGDYSADGLDLQLFVDCSSGIGCP